MDREPRLHDQSVCRTAPMVAVALVMALLQGCSGAPPAEPPDPAEVIATVDGSPITRGEFDEVVRGEVARKPRGVVTDEIRRGALETLVGTELMHRAAIADGLSVAPERLAEELEGVRSQFASEPEFTAYLERNGLTEAGLEQRASRRLLVAEYARGVVGDTAPSEAELRETYDARRAAFMDPEAVRARQVMARVKRKGDPAENDRIAREAAEQARRRLLDGESWRVVTNELSTGPNAARGGEMEWFARGRWMPAFEEVVFDLQPGELSEPFRTQMGYHVVEVLERRPPTPQPFEAVRTSLAMVVTRERYDAALEAHIRSLLEAATIEIRDETLRRVWAEGGGGNGGG